MARRRILPSETTLKKLVDQGMTHQQIAEWVTKQTGEPVGRTAISAALSRAGLVGEYKPHADAVPWTLRPDHRSHYWVIMLRNIDRMERGEQLDPEQYKRTQNFKRRLVEADAVVHYAPDSPEGPFVMVKRPKGETGWVWREPRKTKAAAS